jgi:hypothetical protein
MEEIMKKQSKYIMAAVVLLIAVFGLFGSCDLLNQLTGNTTTATERVNLFRTDLAGGLYSNLYTHFYDGVTAEYETMRSQDYWDNRPFNANEYESIAGMSDPALNSAGDTATITATLSAAIDYNITFTLKKAENGSFYITVIDFESANDAFDVRFIGK